MSKVIGSAVDNLDLPTTRSRTGSRPTRAATRSGGNSKARGEIAVVDHVDGPGDPSHGAAANHGRVEGSPNAPDHTNRHPGESPTRAYHSAP